MLVGLIIGLIARVLLPGKEPIAAGWLGWLITAIIGVLGALLGTFIGQAIFRDNYVAGWLVSIVGAILLLLLVRFLFGNKTAAV